MTKRGVSAKSALKQDEINRLWKCCDQLENQVLIGMALFSGMRVGEALHAKASWVTDEYIVIPPEQPCRCKVCAKRGGVWKPKTSAGARSIPIPKPLDKPLRQYFARAPDGLKVTRQCGWQRVKRLALRAGIPYLHPHALRASAATLFALNGFNAAELCLIMGWTDIAMAWHYIEIAQAQAGVAEKMAKLYH